MENTREKNKRADGRKKTYFDRENKKKAARTEKTKSVAPEKGKQKKRSSSSKCPYQKKCGGCTYLNLSYEEQLAKKEQFLKKTLKGIVPVKGMVGMENPYHYRNKVNSAFARKKDGTIISGIYEKGTHKVVPVDECLLEDQRADAIIRDIRSLLKSFKIMIYNEDSGYGLLRHVMVRTGFASGEIMVVLVCVSPVFPSKNNFVKALRKLHPEITTIERRLDNDAKGRMASVGIRKIYADRYAVHDLPPDIENGDYADMAKNNLMARTAAHRAVCR